MLTVSVIKDNGRLVPLTLLVMLLNTAVVPMLLAQRIPIRLLLLVVATGKLFLRQEQQVVLGLLEPLAPLAPQDHLAQMGQQFLTV
jgi:hypothetical protein